MVRGGDTVFCDQCNLHYCRTCCNTLKKPVERHRGVTCAANQLGDSKDIGLHRLYILDELCNLRCPRCRTVITNYILILIVQSYVLILIFCNQVFDDFDGCCALYCECQAGFCFFCLKDCGSDAHSHVLSCPKNSGNGLFINASQKNSVHRESRKRAIVQYLMRTTFSDRGLRSSVLHSIEKDLKDLEIIINPSEVGLAGFTPLADTSKHRQHILDEICTLRCPRCRTVSYNENFAICFDLINIFETFRPFSTSRAVRLYNAGINNANPIFVSFASRIAKMSRKITLTSSIVRRTSFPANCTLPQMKSIW